ncbi:ROK family transcriptional regulator [Streptomyces sp. NPDC048606]|uniref:ROK family transcriptional regulator n=1 Tax=Streptomyces sp. NPDC048606 TaxID=3154726 RepID=UPI00343403A7
MNRGDESGGRGGANLPALRGHNDALLLDLLRAAGPPGLGRAEIADRTGLTPQAVSKITARLAAEGLVAEAGRDASTGGKPRTLLRLVPGARHAIGVHVDRDELTAVRVDLAGRVLARTGGPLDFGAGPDPVVDAVCAAVLRVRGRAESETGPLPEPLGVGVAAPGPLDWRGGVLGPVTGFPQWAGYPLREVLEGRLGLPVVLDKDTNAGVAAAPAGPGTAASAYLHVGTGLGAGLRLDGAIHRGARSTAGEFGHQVLHLDGPLCRCGARGCLEVLCLEAVARGDVASAARILGEGAANLVALLDVDAVLLGGRVVDADPEAFVTGVRAALAGRGAGHAATTVTRAARDVAEGAAELALSPFYATPPPFTPRA